ncbi:MAG: hypothetical protein OEZ43_09340 [Gammaproteobacteria bacterium]|nr:hypothetical protein [Gammaproteobacteria bacterium]
MKAFINQKFKHRLSVILLCQFLGFHAYATGTQHQQLLPVDEADRDPSLLQFRERLLTAARHHEPERLVELVDIGIFNGVNRPAGAQEFADIWRIDAFESDFWDILRRVVNLGGGFVRSEKGVLFCSPYIFTEFPGNLDGRQHGALIKEKAELMSQPSSASDVVTSLSYNVLKVHDWNPVPDLNGTEGLFWLKVSTLDGTPGFLQREDIYGPNEHSACFLQNDAGHWKMVSFFTQIGPMAGTPGEMPNFTATENHVEE